MLAARKRAPHQAHSLIHLHVITDFASFANDRPGGVIDKKLRADPGSRMQVNARPAVRPFAHDAWNQRHVFLVKLVRQPVNAYRRLTQEGDTRAKLLERIGKLTPKELPKMGRAYVEDILQTWRDTGESLPTQGVATKMWNDWHKLGDEAKKKLFPLPHVRENWDHFFEGVRRIAANPNPSGTATVNQSLAQFATPAGLYAAGSPVLATISAIAPSALAALMYTPRGAALMRKGFRIPAGDIAAATAWSNQVGNMVEQLTRQPAAAAAGR